MLCLCSVLSQPAWGHSRPRWGMGNQNSFPARSLLHREEVVASLAVGCSSATQHCWHTCGVMGKAAVSGGIRQSHPRSSAWLRQHQRVAKRGTNSMLSPRNDQPKQRKAEMVWGFPSKQSPSSSGSPQLASGRVAARSPLCWPCFDCCSALGFAELFVLAVYRTTLKIFPSPDAFL